tara:strand:- start:534 stop:731 length:198 start_codon:yes stop_codon:yes gene_type:complete
MQVITVNVTTNKPEPSLKTESFPKTKVTSNKATLAQNKPTKNNSHGLLSDLFGFTNISIILTPHP